MCEHNDLTDSRFTNESLDRNVFAVPMVQRRNWIVEYKR